MVHLSQAADGLRCLQEVDMQLLLQLRVLH
jgi:hypothetical protein